MVETTKAMQYIINGANAILSDRKMRIAPKYMQVLCTNILQAIAGIHANCCLAGIAMIVSEQCGKIEAALQNEGVNMNYASEPIPEVYLLRRIPREPAVSERDMLVELPEVTKMCKAIINMEYTTGADVRMYPVVEEMGRGGQLQQKDVQCDHQHGVCDGRQRENVPSGQRNGQGRTTSEEVWRQSNDPRGGTEGSKKAQP